MQFRVFFISLFLLSVVSYTAGALRVGSILWGDTRYYYAYTRSLVVDRDINFVNEAYRAEVGFPNPPEIATATLRVTNKFSLGAPLLWIPGFVVGQVVSWIAEVPASVQHGNWPSPDGYTAVTQYVVALTAIALSVGGLYLLCVAVQTWLIRQMKFTQRQATRWSMGVAGVLYATTQLFYYTSVDPLNSHSASFFASSWAFWLVAQVLVHGWTWRRALALGGIGALLFLIRAQDVLVVAPALIWLLVAPQKSQPVAAIKVRGAWQRLSYGRRIGLLVLAAFPVLIALGLQQAVTWYLFGEVGNPYLLRGESFAWLQPDFARVLLSPGNGLFFFAPMTAIMWYGLAVLARRRLIIGWLGLGVFALQLYIIAAWGPEIVGGPYGSRMFVSSLPWLAIGLVPIAQYLERHRLGRWWMWGAIGLAAANNLVQTIVMLVRF